MKIGETVGVLHSFTWNYVKYANMEGIAETVTYITFNYMHTANIATSLIKETKSCW